MQFRYTSATLRCVLVRALGVLLIVACLRVPAVADQCQSIKDQGTQIQIEIDKATTHLYSKCCGPGLPPKPIKDPEVQKQIDALKKQYSAVEQQLSACNAPPAAPPLTVKAFTAENIGVPDPQIAVGHKYFAAIDSSHVGFYRKSDQKFVAAFPDVTDAGQMFGEYFKAINEWMHLPNWVCDPDHPEPVLYTEGPHKGHIKANFGCIGDWYDARTVYDAKRHRFWVASALRHFLWECNVGGTEGLETEGRFGVVWDPSPLDPSGKTDVCHTDWDQSWFHRFLAIAVSQTNSAGEEDLSKPFHKYILTDTLGDWPEIAVNDDYLVVAHMDSQNRDKDPVEIFNAQDLADGVQDGSTMAVKPLLTIAYADLFAYSGAKQFSPDPYSDIYLVTNHGSSDGMTYFLSSNGNRLLVYGVKAPEGNPSGKPRFVMGAAVDLGHSMSGMRNNAVFRDGRLYIASFDCTRTAKKACSKYVGRIVRVPVRLTADGRGIHADGPGSEGFLDYVVGKGDSLSYENTMVEVTKDRDMVFGFEGIGLEANHREPAGVKYAVFYHDRGNITHNGTVKLAVGSAMPKPADPGGARGVIDLGGIALDPSDDQTVWISHGFSDHGKYTEIVGAVKP